VIGTQPLLGRVLLISVALGLASYALWQLVQAVADPDGEGRDARGIAKRIGHGSGPCFAWVSRSPPGG
jgi:hypothetical protein